MNNEYNTEDDDLIEDLPLCKNKNERRLESRLSISFPSKGLYNAPGDNNCFLNAAVQILWHLNVFRRSFRLLQGHACLENACIFCALKRMFQKLQDSDASAIDPDDLRQSMAKAFVDEHRFQLGRMDDAAECFENILHRLHCHIANTESEDTCSAKHCIPHQKFASHILEQVSCKCKATGEPKSYYQFVHYVSASALTENFHNHGSNPNVLVDLLKSSIQSGEVKACPDLKRCLYRNSGKNTALATTTLINCPDVLTVGVIWDTDSPTSNYILDVFDCFQNSLYLKNIFDNIPDHHYKHLELKVVGVVCYYGKHYTSFFYNSREEQWIYFDDAHVKKIGRNWTNVIDKCCRSRFQPLLVIYANSSGSPVDVSNSPASVNVVSKEMLLSKPKSPPHRKHKRKTKRSKDTKLNGHESNRSKSNSINKSHSNDDIKVNLIKNKLPDSPLKENQENESFNPAYRSNTYLPGSNSQRGTTRPLPNVEKLINVADRKSENMEQTNVPKHLPSQNNIVNESLNPAYRSNTYLPGFNSEILTARPLPYVEKPMNIADRRSENMEQTNVPENSQKNNYIKKRIDNIKNVISPKKQNSKKEILPLRSNSMDSIFQNEINDSSFKSYIPNQETKLNVHQKTLIDLESKMNRSSSIDVLDSAHNQQKKTINKKRSTGQKRNDTNNVNSAEVVGSRYKQKNLFEHSTASNSFLTNSLTSTEVSRDPKSTLEVRNSSGSKSNGTSSISSTELVNSEPYDEDDPLIDPLNDTYDLLNNSFTNNDGRSSTRKAVQFDFLLNRGEKMLRKSVSYEESGDLLLASRHCTDATRLFRDAIKLVDNDLNLVEVVDNKRWMSFSRSEMLQAKIDNCLQLNDLHLVEKTIFDQQNERNSTRKSFNTLCDDFNKNNASLTLIPRDDQFLHGCNENILRSTQTNLYTSDAFHDQSSFVGLSNTQNRLPSHKDCDIKGLPIPKQSLPPEEKIGQIDHTKLTFGKTIYSVYRIKDLTGKKCNVEELSRENKTVPSKIEENREILSVSDTRKKLEDNKRYHCKQCGWRKVNKRGDYCDKCKSEYI